MSYALTADGSIACDLGDGRFVHLPAAPNGTAAWAAYQDWLDAGNSPTPYEAPVRPDYISFWEELLGSSLYGAVREQASTTLAMNAAATELIALLGDAKTGRPNEALLQQAVQRVLTLGSFTAEQLAELQAAATAHDLTGALGLT